MRILDRHLLPDPAAKAAGLVAHPDEAPDRVERAVKTFGVILLQGGVAAYGKMHCVDDAYCERRTYVLRQLHHWRVGKTSIVKIKIATTTAIT